MGSESSNLDIVSPLEAGEFEMGRGTVGKMNGQQSVGFLLVLIDY